MKGKNTMNIEDIRINHKYIDNKGTIHIAKAINGCNNPYIVNENDENIPVAILSPYTKEPYLSTDEFGHTSLCIDINQGTFIANIDTTEECGYNALYASFRPKNMEQDHPSGIDLFAMRDDPVNKISDKDIRILSWSDIYKENPELDYTVYRKDMESAWT